MGQHVELYTGRVGHRRGVKPEGLSADPPVIDCSGWVGVLFTQAMKPRTRRLAEPSSVRMI